MQDRPLLPASTGTSTTEFLGLHPSRISDQEGPVIVDEAFLEAHGVCGIDIFGVVRDEGLGNGLADSVHLGRVPSSLDPDSDINAGELVFTDDENGFVDLETEDLGLNEVYGGTVDTDDSTALPSVCDGGCGLVDGETD